MKKKKQEMSILSNNAGVTTVEIMLILVEKPNAKHRYVLCGK